MINSDNEKVIDGHKYIVGNFPAMYNYTLCLKLLAYSSNTLPEILNGVTRGKDDVNYYEIGEAISKFVKSIYANDPSGELIMEILSQTQRDGVAIKKDTFDKFYTGNMAEMIAALYHSCEVHFGHFFSKELISGFLTKKEDKQA